MERFDLVLRRLQAEAGLFAKKLDCLDLAAGEHQLLDRLGPGRRGARTGHRDRLVATSPGDDRESRDEYDYTDGDAGDDRHADRLGRVSDRLEFAAVASEGIVSC